MKEYDVIRVDELKVVPYPSCSVTVKVEVFMEKNISYEKALIRAGCLGADGSHMLIRESQ